MMQPQLAPIREVGEDPRKRTYVLPTRVMLTRGNVTGEDALLHAQALQVHMHNDGFAMLDNRGDNVTEKAGILLDFGRELVGGVRLLCSSLEGSYPNPHVLIRFGESAGEAMTPIGEKGACNDHALREFEGRLTFMSDQEWGQTGFRFVYIQLQELDSAARLKAVLAVFTRRDLEYKGSFRCSDPLLDKIFDVSAYTCHLCMQLLLWDGIKRDRLVWIGDSHPEMMTIRSVFGYQKMLEDSLDDVVADTPLPGWMNGMTPYSAWWLRIMWDWYCYTGNRAYPEKHKAYIQGLADQFLGIIGEDGQVQMDWYFMDWPSNNTPIGKAGVQALIAYGLEAAVNLLGLWDDTARIEKVRAGIERIKAFPADPENYKPAVALRYLTGMLSADKAAAILTADGTKTLSTFMCLYVFTAMAKTGHTTEALRLLRTYYGRMLEMGATTFWEDFNMEWAEGACPIDRLPAEGEPDVHGDFGAFCYKQYRHSLCHGWSSGPVTFLLESVMGIAFDEPGGKKITVKPDLGDLAWAEATYPLPDGGLLRVRCDKSPDGVAVQVDAPAGITVTVVK